jgi:hypothetical protein
LKSRCAAASRQLAKVEYEAFLGTAWTTSLIVHSVVIVIVMMQPKPWRPLR